MSKFVLIDTLARMGIPGIRFCGNASKRIVPYVSSKFHRNLGLPVAVIFNLKSIGLICKPDKVKQS